MSGKVISSIRRKSYPQRTRRDRNETFRKVWEEWQKKKKGIPDLTRSNSVFLIHYLVGRLSLPPKKLEPGATHHISHTHMHTDDQV